MTSEWAREVRSWDIHNPTLETKRYDQIDAFSYRTRYFLTKTHENPKSWKKFFKKKNFTTFSLLCTLHTFLKGFCTTKNTSKMTENVVTSSGWIFITRHRKIILDTSFESPGHILFKKIILVNTWSTSVD